MYPSYLNLFQNGELKKRAGLLRARLESCAICPRVCKVNRLKNEEGFCKTGLRSRIYSYMPHHGEEPVISGERGSGTIFFSGCNMRCAYCQNFSFSQEEEGREVDADELADCMLELQELSCHNINLVTPTHVMPQILDALLIAAAKGLKIPLAYNTSGYELAEILALLDGIVDIYLSDARYANNTAAIKYSQAPNYPQYNQEALKEMQRQVGVAEMDNQGIIIKGLIIRHLVLPDDICGIKEIMKFIRDEISKDTFISLMSQYTPFYKAADFKELSRKVTYEEYEKAKTILSEYGLTNGWTQDSGGLPRFAGIHIKPR